MRQGDPLYFHDVLSDCSSFVREHVRDLAGLFQHVQGIDLGRDCFFFSFEFQRLVLGEKERLDDSADIETHVNRNRQEVPVVSEMGVNEIQDTSKKKEGLLSLRAKKERNT